MGTSFAVLDRPPGRRSVDQRGDRARLRQRDGVRRAELDGRRSGSLGHGALGCGWDGAVVRRDRPFGGGEDCGNSSGQVASEDAGEGVLPETESYSPRPAGVGRGGWAQDGEEEAPREAPDQVKHALALIRGEGGDVDEADGFRGVGAQRPPSAREGSIQMGGEWLHLARPSVWPAAIRRRQPPGDRISVAPHPPAAIGARDEAASPICRRRPG